MTHRDLAHVLKLSESSVKRIISSNRCTLDRLEAICHCLQLDLSDLLNSTPRKRRLLNPLTWKQEEALTQNKELLVLAVCVMNLWSLGDGRHSIYAHSGGPRLAGLAWLSRPAVFGRWANGMLGLAPEKI